MGFMDGIRDVLGGFNAVKQIDSDGFDWREKRAAQQFARDRQVEEARQQDEDRAVNQIADAYAGAEGGQEPDVSPLLQGIEQRRQKFMLDRARGIGKERGSARDAQKAYTTSLIQSGKDTAAMERERYKGELKQNLMSQAEEIRQNQQMSPREKDAALMRIQAQFELFDRAESGRNYRAQNFGTGTGFTKVGGTDESGTTGTWLIPKRGGEREFVPAGPTAATRGKEEAKGAAMNAFGELMGIYDRFGGQPEGGIQARFGGLQRKGEAMAGYNPEVRTYESGVRGFVPLMARALGHVGVLTELDVERTEALFPRPGDTAAEATQKRALLGEIMSGRRPMPFQFEGQQQAEQAPPQRRSGSTQPPAGGGEPIEIGSRAEMAALPPGTRFRYNGKVYTKKR